MSRKTCCGREPVFIRNWIGFFVLGTINNLAYVVVNSSAQSLATSFNKRDLLALIPWANVASGVVVRGVNAFAFQSLAYRYRMLAAVAMMVLGLVGLSCSVYVNFAFAIVMIVVLGSASSYGESVLLGYQRRYPSEMVGGWSSGTGMAGVSGSLLYILFSGVLAFTNQMTFLALLPTVIIYQMAYGQILLEPTDEQREQRKREEAEAQAQKQLGKNKAGEASHDALPMLPSGDDSDEGTNSVQEQAPLVPKALKTTAVVPANETTGQRYWRCTKLVAWQALNLTLVYFFEYVASVGAADRAQPPGSLHSPDWFVRNSFILLAFCYQAGVFVSRSSLQVVRIRRVEILTILQAANFVLWILQAVYKFMPIGAQLPMMVFVGLLGGASYVNIFYNLLHDDDYPEEDRELIINMAAIMINVGIMLASVFTLIMAATFLHDK